MGTFFQWFNQPILKSFIKQSHNNSDSFAPEWWWLSVLSPGPRSTSCNASDGNCPQNCFSWRNGLLASWQTKKHNLQESACCQIRFLSAWPRTTLWMFTSIKTSLKGGIWLNGSLAINEHLQVEIHHQKENDWNDCEISCRNFRKLENLWKSWSQGLLDPC